MRKYSWKKVATAAVLGAALLMTGCSADSSEPNDDAGDGASQTLKVRLYSGMATTDPFPETSAPGWHLLRHVYEGLFALDLNLEPQPLLAESYKVSDDGMTVDITLRNDVIFHNDKKMTADDVAYSLNYYVQNASNKSYLVAVDTVTKTDELNVQIKMKNPSGSIIADLANPVVVPIVPEGSAEDMALVTKPIGTGPYYIESFDPQVRAVLKKFDKYVSPKGEASGLAGKREAKVGTLEWIYAADDSVAVAGLETGDFDVMVHVPGQAADRLSKQDGLQILKSPGASWVAIGINGSKGPLANVEVRKALVYATDPSVMLETVAFGQGRDVHSYNPSEASWFREGKTNSWPYAFDVAKAKEILAKTGYNGEPIEIITGAPPYQEQNAVILQQQAMAAGFNIKVNKLEHTTFIERLQKGDFELYSAAGPFAATADQYYSQFYCGGGSISNRFDYCNPKYDAIFKSASVELDADKRNDTFAELEVILKNDAMVLPLYVNNFILGARDYVSGLTVNPFDWVLLWNVSMK